MGTEGCRGDAARAERAGPLNVRRKSGLGKPRAPLTAPRQRRNVGARRDAATPRRRDAAPVCRPAPVRTP